MLVNSNYTSGQDELDDNHDDSDEDNLESSDEDEDEAEASKSTQEHQGDEGSQHTFNRKSALVYWHNSEQFATLP